MYDLPTITKTAARMGGDLVSAWMSIYAGDLTQTEMAALLSEETGIQYDGARLRQWRHGLRSVPEPAQIVMRLEILRYLLGDEPAGVIAPLMKPPERR